MPMDPTWSGVGGITLLVLSEPDVSCCIMQLACLSRKYTLYPSLSWLTNLKISRCNRLQRQHGNTPGAHLAAEAGQCQSNSLVNALQRFASVTLSLKWTLNPQPCAAVSGTPLTIVNDAAARDALGSNGDLLMMTNFGNGSMHSNASYGMDLGHMSRPGVYPMPGFDAAYNSRIGSAQALVRLPGTCQFLPAHALKPSIQVP